jgi:hypothetical protein
VAVKMLTLSCKIVAEKEAFNAVLSVLPQATQEELMRAQGRIVILSEPDEVAAPQAKK